MKKLRFPGVHSAVFNGHVNNASDRALKCLKPILKEDDLSALEKTVATEVMMMFNRAPSHAESVYASVVFIFANGLDKEEQ